MTTTLRANVGTLLGAFVTWLAEHPVDGDQHYGGSSVRYQVSRYCDYLHTNPWPGGDPLRDARARDGAANAYSVYLDTFNTPPATVRLIMVSLDHFYVFLGLGRVTVAGPAAAAVG